MLMEIIAYLLIACQLDLVLCRPRPQSQNFNGSNPYYDRYNNQYWGDNSYNVNPYSSTQKSLYPTLYPFSQSSTPSYYGQGGQGQYNPFNPNPETSTPQNRNSSIKIPNNNFGGNDSFYGWNGNFNPQTTSPSYQPYGQSVITTTTKPPITTLPPYYNSGSFNRYNRTNPTNPSSRPQTTFSFGHDQRNFTNNYNNSLTNRNWNKNSTSNQYPNYPQSTGSIYPNPNPTIGQGANNNNFFNNKNVNRTHNNYPSYRPSAPPQMPQGNVFPTKPTFDQNGVPLATYQTFHANIPTDDNLFNYDNLHRRRPNSGMDSGPYDSSNVPLAPFPGSRGSPYGFDSNLSAPLAPLNDNRGPVYGIDSNQKVPLAPFPGRG